MKKKIGIHFIPRIVLMAMLLLCMVLTVEKVSASDFSDGNAEEGKYIEEDQDDEILQNPDIVDFKINNGNILGYSNVLEISFKIANIDVSKYGYYVGSIDYSCNEHSISIPMYITLDGVISGRMPLDTSYAEGVYEFKEFYPSYFSGNVTIKNKDVTNSKFTFCNNCQNDIHRIEKFAYKAPTCTEDGNTEMKMCKICKTIFEGHILSATGHTWSTEYTIENNATCTESGTKDIRCIKCGEIKQDSAQEIPATGHKEVKDAAVAATCETPGRTEGSHCSVCNKVIKEQKEVPALGHNWDSGKVTKAATCTETGVKTYSCTVCGTTKTETIAKTTEHKFGKWTKVSDATVFAKQKQKRICSICGKTEKRDYGNKLKATIKLNITSITLQQKQTTKPVKVTMAKGDSVKSWTSNNKKVVTVDKNGIIKAQKKNGTAKITVTLKSGKKATVTIKVQNKKITTSKITGLKSKITLKKGKKLILKPILSPVASQDKITYATSNKSVATISSKGIITAKAKGTAVITVKSGKKLVRCKVTVK